MDVSGATAVVEGCGDHGWGHMLGAAARAMSAQRCFWCGSGSAKLPDTPGDYKHQAQVWVAAATQTNDFASHTVLLGGENQRDERSEVQGC